MDALTRDGSGPYETLKELRDWTSFLGNAAIGATLASYFGSGLFGQDKIKDVFLDELTDAFDRDTFTNEDPEEREEE